MKVYDKIPASSPDQVLAIGTFDGLHRGHKFVIERACEYAINKNLPVSVLTFEPEPAIYFNNIPVYRRRLLTIPDKLRIIDSLNVDNVYNLPFDEKMASTRAEEFIRDILIKKLNIRAVFVGDDFRFGRGRAGDASLLKEIAGESRQSFEAKVFSDVELDGIPLSSSLIREEIVKGNIQTARKMLGRPYTVHEKLQKGSGRGKKLGFPTLNFSLENTIRPRFGVYTVWLGRTEQLPAIASFGVHPTVDELSAPILEVHTLGEAPDLKPGQEKHIYFEQFCRPEEKFASLAELKKGIKQDVEEARRIFLKAEKPAPIY